MNALRHARYIGPHPELRGCGALVRRETFMGRYVFVQFDRVKAAEADNLRFGWHCFPRRHFVFRRSQSQSAGRRS